MQFTLLNPLSRVAGSLIHIREIAWKAERTGRAKRLATFSEFPGCSPNTETKLVHL